MAHLLSHLMRRGACAGPSSATQGLRGAQVLAGGRAGAAAHLAVRHVERRRDLAGARAGDAARVCAVRAHARAAVPPAAPGRAVAGARARGARGCRLGLYLGPHAGRLLRQVRHRIGIW